jgi:anionic cell wall polymer biosynthesis LytR-Cps2A-Psr (LCP) family protein
MRRTQEVAKAIFNKVMTPAGLLKIPQIVGVFDSSVESNLSSDELLPLARFGMGFDLDEDVRWYIIGQNEVTSWMTPGGAAVLLPNTPAIQAILQDALIFE